MGPLDSEEDFAVPHQPTWRSRAIIHRRPGSRVTRRSKMIKPMMTVLRRYRHSAGNNYPGPCSGMQKRLGFRDSRKTLNPKPPTSLSYYSLQALKFCVVWVLWARVRRKSWMVRAGLGLGYKVGFGVSAFIWTEPFRIKGCALGFRV